MADGSDLHALVAGFADVAAVYERGRPDYPPAMVERVVAELGAAEGARVLDLGAGTGKLTRPLLAARLDVVAVEPMERMRAALAAAIGADRALDGRAEALPFEDGALDGAVCGEAFHWFDGASALASIHRVLRPDAGLGLVWNVHEWDHSAGWVRAIEALIAPYSDRRPSKRYTSGHWLRAFQATALFGPFEQASFPHVQRLGPDGLAAHVGSVAFIAALPEHTREPIVAQVRRLFDLDPTLRAAGEVTIRYRTDAYASLASPISGCGP
jgi:SAM-dependent methyltransferase